MSVVEEELISVGLLLASASDPFSLFRGQHSPDTTYVIGTS